MQKNKENERKDKMNGKYIDRNNNSNTENTDGVENREDVTKYGEFVSSYFAWLTPEKQKKRANEIDNMTK